jgi:hypothetical protein
MNKIKIKKKKRERTQGQFQKEKEKNAHEKSLKSIQQSLMAGPNCQAGRGKDVQQQIWARHGFYRRRSLRKLVHAQ